ncbi:MAG: hypothetical protein LUD72_10455, partial [Bacteroidales bacterium]|nr:hypothetical protein [Bacteroidales bacterium]
MKRDCKNIDVTDWMTVKPWVYECISRHYKRYDFRHLLRDIGGMTSAEYARVIDGDKEPLDAAVENIAKEAAKRIGERKLNLPPVKIRLKEDHSTFKVRMIGLESAMQQVFDYIAVRACTKIWDRRVVPQQASSIKGRGPSYGVAMISKWLRRDTRASEWAKRHHRRYRRKYKYFVHLDITQCYASLRIEPFMKWFCRDCGNQDLIWLWNEIFESHHVPRPDNGEIYEGYMIGALPSQQACQYVLSFLYRYVMSLHKMRHGKLIKQLSGMVMFMDDMLLFSPSRHDLEMAVNEMVVYARDEFGLTIKPNWQICDIEKTPADMMGYLVRADGSITVRPRVFLRVRRLAM